MQVILLFGLFVGTALCCSYDEYTCYDGTCIQGSYQCDSWVDCSLGEDDLGCPGCDSNRFLCSNGLYCIIWWGVCDGTDDCGDGSDERGCSNLIWGRFPCITLTTMKVILLFGLFVGTALCCSYDQYTCGDGECISGNYQCDSWVDCSKGEDDMGCPGCDSDRFLCDNGDWCVKWWGVCDGEDNCGDNSDERGCSNLCWYNMPYSKRGLTSSSDDKVVSRGINKRGKVEAAGTNVYKKKNEAEKAVNKLEKLRLLSMGKDGK